MFMHSSMRYAHSFSWCRRVHENACKYKICSYVFMMQTCMWCCMQVWVMLIIFHDADVYVKLHASMRYAHKISWCRRVYEADSSWQEAGVLPVAGHAVYERHIACRFSFLVIKSHAPDMNRCNMEVMSGVGHVGSSSWSWTAIECHE